MSPLRYSLYAFAAALMAAATSLKDSADNVPEDNEDDGVIAGTTGTETTLNNLAAPAVDKNGVPHDPTIHAGTKTIKAGTKTIKADGTWTRRKGVSDVDFNAGMARLKAAAPTAPAAPQLPTAPAAPLSLVPPIGAVAPLLTNYQKLCAFLAANTGPGKRVDDAWVTKSLADQGTSMALLAADEAASASWQAAFETALA